eukprot:1360947-Pyramimonas_sp.AAC.1
MAGGMCAAQGGGPETSRNEERRHEIWGNIRAPAMIATPPPGHHPPLCRPREARGGHRCQNGEGARL